MQVLSFPKQKSSPFFESAPKRSLSYNDLKRKRLIRSQKSKIKIHPQQSEKLIIRTEKKKPQEHFSIGLSSGPNTAQAVKKIQRSINQLKEVFDEIKQKTKTKKYIISKPFYTDRVNNDDRRKISFIEKSTAQGNGKVSLFYESVDMAGNEKQLIKQIISKKKSQRRLLKFDEIRAEVKRSKSKSKSKSKLNIGQEQTAPHSKIIHHSSSQEIMQRSQSRKNIRVNKFETVHEQPLNKYSHIKISNTQVLANNYFTSNVTANKQVSELGEKSQYRSRRKLKIDDFKTERKDIQLTKQGQKSSETRLKFHRRLRKTNSEIVIKTSQTMYNKSKYTTRLESKSTLNVKPFTQRHEQQISNKSLSVSKPTKKSSFTTNHEQQKQIHQSQQKQYHFITKQENDDQMNLLKDLELSAINISEIQIRKEHSFTEIQNDISLVNAIEAQQLQILMKLTKPKPSQNGPEESKQMFKKSKKQTPQKSTSAKRQNVQNIENLSNLLDFISLPTEQLKVKINRCSTKIVKKKNEMQKFKKIFPANFFNK